MIVLVPEHCLFFSFSKFPCILVKDFNDLNSKIAYNFYMHFVYLHRNKIYSCKWILCVEKILQDVGLNYIWLNHDIVNIY